MSLVLKELSLLCRRGSKIQDDSWVSDMSNHTVGWDLNQWILSSSTASIPHWTWGCMGTTCSWRKQNQTSTDTKFMEPREQVKDRRKKKLKCGTGMRRLTPSPTNRTPKLSTLVPQARKILWAGEEEGAERPSTLPLRSPPSHGIGWR